MHLNLNSSGRNIVDFSLTEEPSFDVDQAEEHQSFMLPGTACVRENLRPERKSLLGIITNFIFAQELKKYFTKEHINKDSII